MKLYKADELIKKYSNKYIDVYPHHTYWNDKTHKYETVYEVRKVSKIIRENCNLPEDCIK